MERNCVRGYHVYKNIYGKQQSEKRLAVWEDWHSRQTLPRKVSRVCALLLKRGGSIQCTVTGKRRYSADLLQGDQALLPLVAVEPSWIHEDAMMYKTHTLTDVCDHL